MFTKMMICTDLSPESFALITCAIELKKIGTREAVLTHVFHAAASASGKPLPADVEHALERQNKTLDQQGIKVTVELLTGAPAQTLDEIAEKHDVSAILTGSLSGGLIKSAALGSVPADLLRRARCPLLLKRIDLREEGTSGGAGCGEMFSSVLFPTDFSETAERALDYLGKIALESGCAITLLHVIAAKGDDSAAANRSEEDARYLLEAKKRRLERLGAAEVGIDLVHGNPADEIVARAKSGLFSLVVMGCQGKGILTRVFMGSTADQVARHAELPLLLVPGEHHVE